MNFLHDDAFADLRAVRGGAAAERGGRVPRAEERGRRVLRRALHGGDEAGAAVRGGGGRPELQVLQRRVGAGGEAGAGHRMRLRPRQRFLLDHSALA
jgi:hypothetical protein